MLRHFVFLEIKDEANAIETIKASLAELSKKTKGCVDFQFGKCQGDNDSHHYFFMDFVDEDSRDVYLSHPEHVKVATEIIIPRLERGLESATVFDYVREGHPQNISHMQKDPTGYILVKAGEEEAVLAELANFCDVINSLKPLQNNSKESLARHSYAVQIRLKEEIGTVKLRNGTPFWTSTESSHATGRNISSAPSALRSLPIMAKV
jgi:quinol monooxygenase YgiN